MKIFQLLLLPLSWLYQGILRLRNHLYDTDFMGTTSFDIPTINVGNLAFGGTGKTPHIEYLIKYLVSKGLQVSIMSRGYKRKTIGYVFAEPNSSPFSLGDEPYQLYSKFPNVAVAVSENRVLGIPNLLYDAPHTAVILLDDAYQHRALKPGLNILLTEQNKLYTNDYLVPSGYLREYAAAAKRADIIIVSKCNTDITAETKNAIIQKINPLPHQQVFFSHIAYAPLKPYFDEMPSTNAHAILGVCGIARPTLFEDHLKSLFPEVRLKSYPDHHVFTEKDIDWIVSDFEQIETTNKAIITTEKDYQKLLQSPYFDKIKDFPLYYLPIEVVFSKTEETAFQQIIYTYVSTNPRKF